MATTLDKKHYTYAIAVIVGATLLAIVVGVFIIRPLYNKNAQLALDVQEKQKNLDKLEAKLVALKGLKSKEEELNAEKDRVISALPYDKDVSRLFVQLENVVSDTGGLLTKADSGAAVASSTGTVTTAAIPGVTSHDYALDFTTSTYESVKNVFINSEEALRLLNINGFSLDAKDNKFSVQLKVNSYSREEAAQ